jgi:hypothetical protein
MIKMHKNTKNLKTAYVGFMLVNNLFKGGESANS